MLEVICLFFPAFITLYLDTKKNNLTNLVIIIQKYFIYNIIINIIVLLGMAINNQFSYYLMDSSKFTIVFTIKYLLLAIVSAFIIPVFNYFVNDILKVKVKVIKESKNEKSKKRN